MNRKELKEVLIKRAEEYHLTWQQNQQIWQQQEDRRKVKDELRQTIERCALQWYVRGKREDLLLQKEFLFEAKKFYIESSELLSFNAHKYLIASIEAQNSATNSTQLKQRQQLIGALTATIAFISISSLSTTTSSTMLKLDAVPIFNTLEPSLEP